MNITLPDRADTLLNYFCDSRSTYSNFIQFGVFRAAMKKEPLKHNIYFVIQPLHFVSRVLGLSPVHIDPKTKCHNGRVCIYSHIILATVMIIFLLYGLYNSILLLYKAGEGLLNISIRVLWNIYMLVSNLTNILALIFAVTRNRNYMTKVLCLLSRADNKLFHNTSKQSAYSQQRSHVIKQLWITLISHVTASTSCVYSFYGGMWECNMYIVSQILGNAINAVMILQYVNIVLLVKQRYNHVKHLMSEADPTTEVDISRCFYVEDVTSNSSNRIFSSAKVNLESNRESHNTCKIHDLQIIFSELYDVLYANNQSYQVLILLSTIAILTNTVPIIYCGIILTKFAVLSHYNFENFFKGLAILFMCAFKLLSFLWLTWCCQTTTEEVQDTFVCIQKLLLYPNSLGWNKSDLKSLLFQLKNMKVEFNICGFFTLNLQFFCASVSVIITYILVLNQFSQGV